MKGLFFACCTVYIERKPQTVSCKRFLNGNTKRKLWIWTSKYSRLCSIERNLLTSLSVLWLLLIFWILEKQSRFLTNIEMCIERFYCFLAAFMLRIIIGGWERFLLEIQKIAEMSLSNAAVNMFTIRIRKRPAHFINRLCFSFGKKVQFFSRLFF